MNAPLSFATHPLAAGVAPEWASEWGEDAYGGFAGFTVSGVTQIMRWIPPGSFMMGSLENETGHLSDESPQHRVTFASGFWLCDTACTQALWKAVMGDNPSRFQRDRRPVESVSWNDAQRFIERVNAEAPGLNLSLPTEAQWEYACRATSKTAFNFGEMIDPTRANFERNYLSPHGEAGEMRPQTVDVATFAPNAWGLHEMHGNVWEWCEDVFHSDYRGAPNNGTAWLENTEQKPRRRREESGAGRVLRGGSWSGTARRCRSAFRYHYFPVGRIYNFGFRCARVQGRARSGARERGGESGEGRSPPDRGPDRARSGR